MWLWKDPIMKRLGEKLTDAEWWVRYDNGTLVDCTWDPDTDPGKVDGLCRDPDHLSDLDQRRCRRLLDMLLHVPSREGLTTARKIIAAHPQMRVEYAKRIEQCAKRMRAYA
jgi:hypothetical protein